MGILEPSYLTRLKNPDIENILLVGCGGGFDFVHSMLLYPTLKTLGKKIIMGSYSFGLTANLPETASCYDSGTDIEVRLVNGSMKADPHYAPEIHLCSYLDRIFPQEQHEIFAYYARDCTVPKLTTFYSKLCWEYSIDAVLAFDGGSDSLMVGDEAGLGDPIEDLVSITAIHNLSVKEKILFNIGMGVDKYNDVSDASTMRAIAELTEKGGYLGCSGIEPNSEEFLNYRDAIDFIFKRQSFQSKVAGFILSSIEGAYGNRSTFHLPFPENKEKEHYIWPVMAILWSFQLDVVAKRSMISRQIKDKKTMPKIWQAVTELRKKLGDGIKETEDFPLHETMRCEERYDFTQGKLVGGYFEEAAIVEELED